MPFRGGDGGVPLYRLNTYIIETPVDIQFCEVSGSAELRDEFRDEGEQISVLDGYGI